MTAAEQQAEWNYRHEERIAIMCGSKEPTEEQQCIATREANEAMEKLSKL